MVSSWTWVVVFERTSLGAAVALLFFKGKWAYFFEVPKVVFTWYFGWEAYRLSFLFLSFWANEG
jgi:hypothetical protein